MLMNVIDPYMECPMLESESFCLRLVRKEDAQDLLTCYSDKHAVPLFNSDNCTSDFYYQSVEEMTQCIGYWVREYEQRYYVRFAIVDKQSKQAIGTIEYFAKDEKFEDYGVVGVLRVDLASAFEREDYIAEILSMVDQQFHGLFGTQSAITKAIPEAQERVSALTAAGYQGLPKNSIVQFDHYYVKVREDQTES